MRAKPRTDSVFFIRYKRYSIIARRGWNRTFPSRRVLSVKLLSRLDLGRHQTDLIHAGAFGDVDRFRHRLKIEIRIALHKNHAFGARFEDLFEPRPKALLIGAGSVLIFMLLSFSMMTTTVRSLSGGGGVFLSGG